MTKGDRNNVIMVTIILLTFFLKILLDMIIFPYVAVRKSAENNFKITCAYIVSKEKTKYGFNYLILIEDREYKHLKILPISTFGFKENELNKFPILKKLKTFLEIEPNKCKKVSYIEIYNFWGFKKFYLYDFIN